MSQPTAPQRGERVRIVLETTFELDASGDLQLLYIKGDSGATYGLPSSDITSVETIAPPKPPEPQGDGAVVEDVTGHRWVRIAGPEPERESKPWRHRGHTARTWEHINPARILSEGVTA